MKYNTIMLVISLGATLGMGALAVPSFFIIGTLCATISIFVHLIQLHEHTAEKKAGSDTTPRITIRVTPELHAKVKFIAHTMYNRTITEYVTDAILQRMGREKMEIGNHIVTLSPTRIGQRV